jgi:hypothetical protein
MTATRPVTDTSAMTSDEKRKPAKADYAPDW